MRLTLRQHAIRFTCGLGLLLLPAVQQKVCAWPLPARAGSRTSAELPAPSNPQQQPKREKKRPLTLAAMLPDVMAPRQPDHTHLAAVQRVRALPAATWMDGPGDFSDRTNTDIAGAFANNWSQQPVPQSASMPGPVGLRPHDGHRHVFRTSILRTGPPHA
jgi:hypothetical protein